MCLEIHLVVTWSNSYESFYSMVYFYGMINNYQIFSALNVILFMSGKSTNSTLPDLDLSLLNVHAADSVAKKFLMLIEGVYGRGVKHSIGKYKYTEQRYYQLLKDFQFVGSTALIDKKRGPNQNTLRTEKVLQQIIRQRFLDPDASASVITERLNQTHFPISLRSVERTIQEYGLQKEPKSK